MDTEEPYESVLFLMTNHLVIKRESHCMALRNL